jgi:hypothetical protein
MGGGGRGESWGGETAQSWGGARRRDNPGRPPALTARRRTPNFPPLRTHPWTVPMPDEKRTHLMDEADVRRAIARMAREIVERNGGTEDLVLMGIHRRGTDVADWIARRSRRPRA